MYANTSSLGTPFPSAYIDPRLDIASYCQMLWMALIKRRWP
jgi:hypothetical protein